MALLSVSDVLLFFTLVMNAIAIAKPRGGLAGSSNSHDSGIELSGLDSSTSPASSAFFSPRQGDDSDNDTAVLLGGQSSPQNGGGAQDAGVVEELSDRAGQLLLSFRRCGVFIAIWNVTLMVAMVFVLS
jgi:hypothetical protein